MLDAHLFIEREKMKKETMLQYNIELCANRNESEELKKKVTCRKLSEDVMYHRHTSTD